MRLLGNTVNRQVREPVDRFRTPAVADRPRVMSAAGRRGRFQELPFELTCELQRKVMWAELRLAGDALPATPDKFSRHRLHAAATVRLPGGGEARAGNRSGRLPPRPQPRRQKCLWRAGNPFDAKR